MTIVTRFEDLIAWQEARKLMQLAYRVTSDGSFSKDFGMRDQFREAALSSMTNIAEGFDNESSIEFARFLGMARRSAVEVQSLCYAALDVKHITQDEFQTCYDQAKKTQAIIGGLKKSVLKNPHRPAKPSSMSKT
ncbi:MAG: four helix bundle protein [Anaerolineales bacterium]|nr:four helix bundle protein [Anaerolineales bacterium]